MALVTNSATCYMTAKHVDKNGDKLAM